MADLYYILAVISFFFFAIVIFFTFEEVLKEDRTGREYDIATFYVVVFGIVNMVLIAILTYQGYNLDTVMYNVTSGQIETYTSTEDMTYMAYGFFVFFLIHIALIAKKVFDFFIASFYEPKEGEWKK